MLAILFIYPVEDVILELFLSLSTHLYTVHITVPVDFVSPESDQFTLALLYYIHLTFSSKTLFSSNSGET